MRGLVEVKSSITAIIATIPEDMLRKQERRSYCVSMLFVELKLLMWRRYYVTAQLCNLLFIMQ